MRVASKQGIQVAIAVGMTAALAAASGCSSADAVEPSGGFELWRCEARNAFYREREAGISPTTEVVAGELVFHGVSPGPEWQSGAAVRFTSVMADPQKRHGNGITASIPDGEHGSIYVSMVVDGQQRLLGKYPYGSAVPFKITFNDEEGTMQVQSGKFEMTATPTDLLRPTMVMMCSGADVSFFDTDIKV